MIKRLLCAIKWHSYGRWHYSDYIEWRICKACGHCESRLNLYRRMVLIVSNVPLVQIANRKDRNVLIAVMPTANVERFAYDL